MRKRSILLSFALSFSFSYSAFAQDLQWTHFGPRPLAMGNAFVAIADDYNALFYNPAGLARLQNWDGEFVNPMFSLSENTTNFTSSLMDLVQGSGSDTTSVLDIFETQSGKSQHVGMGLTPHLIFKHFGFGMGLKLDADLMFHRYPSVNLNSGLRLILPISFALNALEDRLSYGFTFKTLVRTGINAELSLDALDALTGASNENSASLDDYVEGGIGYGVDFGLLFTPTKVMEPTLGISVTDIGGSTYEEFTLGAEATAAPDNRLPAVNIGISAKPYAVGRSYVRTAIDLHAINHPVHFSKKLNLGAEWGYSEIIKVQTGLHQGYLTGGLQFDVGLLNLKIATYGLELGPVAGDQPDRRYVFQLRLLF